MATRDVLHVKPINVNIMLSSKVNSRFIQYWVPTGVLGIDLKNVSTKLGQSKLRNKNMATRDVLHVKPITCCTYFMYGTVAPPCVKILDLVRISTVVK